MDMSGHCEGFEKTARRLNGDEEGASDLAGFGEAPAFFNHRVHLHSQGSTISKSKPFAITLDYGYMHSS